MWGGRIQVLQEKCTCEGRVSSAHPSPLKSLKSLHGSHKLTATDRRYVTRFRTQKWFAGSDRVRLADAQPPQPAGCRSGCASSYKAAYGTYCLTAGLKRATNISKPFSDKTLSNHSGLPQISRQAWGRRGRRCVWMERLGGGKEWAKSARSFEGGQTPQCPCFFWVVFLLTTYQGIRSATCCSLPIHRVFRLLMDLPDAGKEPYPMMFLLTPLAAGLLLPAFPGGGIRQRRALPCGWFTAAGFAQ